MTSNATWAERIRTLRHRLKLDQDEMGVLLGVSREWVSKLEKEKEPPSERVQLKLEKLAAEHGVHFSESGFTQKPAAAPQPIIHGEGETDEFKESSWRIKSALLTAGVDPTEAAARIGLAAEKFDDLLRGRRFLKLREGQDLARVLNVRTEWLRKGEEPRSLGSAAEEQSEGLAVRKVPVISWAHAGEAATYEEMPKHFQGTVATTYRGKRVYGLRVEGVSMEPRYNNGDIVILDVDAEPRNGKGVVVKFANDAVQIRLYHKLQNGKIRLTSTKPDIYPTDDYSLSDFAWIHPVLQTVRDE